MNADKTRARPIFRRLALVVSFVCLGISLAFLAVEDEELRRVGMISSGFVAYTMFTIAGTGIWPPSKKAQEVVTNSKESL
jgi:hypothetical protein